MGQASIKFYKLRKQLERRQEKMETVFDAGSALIQYYRSIDEDDAADSLLATLMERALHCDMAVVEDAFSRGMDLMDGKDYGNSDPGVNGVWQSLDERIHAQTTTMQAGCDEMAAMFIEAFNAGKTGNTHTARPKHSNQRDLYWTHVDFAGGGWITVGCW
jgi:hypothetical protein